METDELSLIDVIRILRRRYKIVCIIAVVFLAASIIRTLFIRPIYRSEAVVLLPTMPSSVFIKRVNEAKYTVAINEFINVSDTRELLGALADNGYAALVPLVGDSASVADLEDVRVDEIFGTDKLFRIYVRVRNHPRSAVVLMEAMLTYLRQHPMVIAQLDMKEAEHKGSGVLAKQKHAAPGLTGIIDKVQASADDASLRPESFQFLRKPTVGVTPYSPLPLRDGIMMGIVGLLIGATVSLMYEILIVRGKPRTTNGGACA